jgi:hypothetical protein
MPAPAPRFVRRSEMKIDDAARRISRAASDNVQ